MINSLITLSKPTFAFFFITMGIAGFVAVIFRDIRRHLVRLILVAMLFICSYYALRVAMQFDFARGILKVSFLTLVACLLWMRRRRLFLLGSIPRAACIFSVFRTSCVPAAC